MLAEVKNLVTGAVSTARGSFDTSVVTQDAHARYQEAVMRGNCYTTANQTAGTTQAGLSGTTPVLTLFNPKGNNKVGVLLYAGATFIVANAAGSAIWLAANVNVAAAAVTGTAATVSNCALGNGNSPSLLAFTAATLPATPIAISQLASGVTGAVTTIPYLLPAGRFFDGSIILLPGSAISIQTSTASGAGTFCEYVWEEIVATA